MIDKDKLLELMKEAGHSKRSLSLAVSTGPTLITDIVKRPDGDTKISTLLAISAELGCSFESLLNVNGAGKKEPKDDKNQETGYARPLILSPNDNELGFTEILAAPLRRAFEDLSSWSEGRKNLNDDDWLRLVLIHAKKIQSQVTNPTKSSSEDNFSLPESEGMRKAPTNR